MTLRPQLILKRSSLSHPGLEDYDVLCEGKLVGRIYNANSSGRKMHLIPQAWERTRRTADSPKSVSA